jgi:Rha family phage regulatory protein
MNQDLFPETLLVSAVNSHTFTTSRKVADHFKKRHFHVLRDIELLLAEISRSNFGFPNTISRPNFEEPNAIGLRNFAASSYTDKRGKTYPEYRLSRDGFSLLAMGFTGREALAWKLKFLEAFNAMEIGMREAMSPPMA